MPVPFDIRSSGYRETVFANESNFIIQAEGLNHGWTLTSAGADASTDQKDIT